MYLKETEELLEIWKTNDHVEWTETAFEIIKEILNTRGVELPEQDKPIYEHEENEESSGSYGFAESESYGFTEMELTIIDDENAPEFYDPMEVLEINKLLEMAAKASIVIAVFLGLTELPDTNSIIRSYFSYDQGLVVISAVIAVAILALGVAFQAVIVYFPIRALVQILKILMEMEFNSRKVKQ
jgi:hypothetical protein